MRTLTAALAACLLAAGCGDSDDSASKTPTPTATPTASPTAFAPSAPEPPEDAPEAEPGGGGDEDPLLQRVRVTVDEERRISPRRLKVSAFLAVDLTIRNRSSREQLVTVAGPGLSRALQAGRGVTATMRLEGLRPGTYQIEVEEGGRARLVAAEDKP